MNRIYNKIRSFDLFGKQAEEIDGCRQHLRKVNLTTLCYTARSCILLSFFIGIVPVIITREYYQLIYMLAYMFAAMVLMVTAKKLLLKDVIPGTANMVIYLFNIISYIYAIIAGIFAGRDNPSVVFVILVVALHAFFMLRASRTFLITMIMSVAFCVCSFIFKDMVHFIYDVRNVILAIAISVPMNYMITQSRITNLIEHKHIKDEYFRLYSDFQKDSQTGLLAKSVTHEGLESYCSRCLEDGIDIFAAMIDVDYFKEYNDTYGHVMGDDVLKQIGAELRQIAIQEKINIGRVGGDEFMAFGIAKNKDHAEKICQIIMQCVNDMKIVHRNSKTPEYLSVSTGVTFIRAGTLIDAIDLYDMADRALYKAKENGRNQIAYQSYDTGAVFSGIVEQELL